MVEAGERKERDRRLARPTFKGNIVNVDRRCSEVEDVSCQDPKGRPVQMPEC